MKKLYFILAFCSVLLSSKLYAQCSTASLVPYYESFTSITTNNQLPPCWVISNSITCLTYTAPGAGSAAAFYYQPAGSNYFYSNGIQLNAGVIYSVSVWYTTAFYATSTWSDFSLLLNTSQTALGATTLATVAGPIIANVMTPLSNTFSVLSSGVYYVAIRGVSNNNGSSLYLSFDDLSIIIPCTPSINTPSVSIVSSATSICNGQPVGQVLMTAVGADSYSWSTGATTPTITENLVFSNTYTVIGTSSLTGCSASASLVLFVKPSPNLILLANPSAICLGNTASLTAIGANSYSWSNGQISNYIAVSPTVSTTYSVVGTHTNGCTATAAQLIQVHPLPNISISSAIMSNTICNGDEDTLNASGALNYTWTYGQYTSLGSQMIVSPSVTTNYVVIGVDANGCESQTSLVLNVNSCTGINQIPQSQSQILLSPNPFQNEFLVSSGNYDLKKIEIIDLSGRRIFLLETNEENIRVNTKYYSMGLYYVKITSNDRSELFKMIKN